MTGPSFEVPQAELSIQPISTDAERAACARIMATSEPWVTLGQTYEQGYRLLCATDREIYVARTGGVVAGFAIVSMQGILSGYLQTIAVAAPFRSRGYGAQLLRFVEARVFRERPNVFLFVSSFNLRARAFYESLGYEFVGEIKDFLVRGYGECLMRKTIGPLFEFNRGSEVNRADRP